MKQRIITAFLIIMAIIPPILLGGVYLDILLIVFALAVVYEFIKVMKQKDFKSAFLIIAIYVLFNLLVNQYYLFESTIVLLIALFFLNVVDAHYHVEQIAYLFMFSFFTVIVLRTFKDIYLLGIFNIVYLLLVTYITDTFAYFGGIKFGKHKLNERISPKKTIEGAVFGYLGGVISGLIFGLNYLSLPSILVIIASLLIPVFSQLGDLAMSSVKRHFNTKDFSNIFPGHGGVLDRIDSLTFAILVFNVLMKVFLV